MQHLQLPLRLEEMVHQAVVELLGQILVAPLLILQQGVRALVDLMAVLGMLIVQVSQHSPQVLAAAAGLQL
jgi:hypothetical protein